ncbi:MAG: zinc-ribbon domain containing protein [Candidatus Gracilibacteria bacterium]|jgi:hypothetical protein
MNKKCKNCGNDFKIFDKDQEFYNKINVQIPTLCATCRTQRRHTFRNERNLYNRKCDLTNKNIISVYSDKVQFPVYDHEAWHSDKWDAIDYGQDFNFNKNFFEQFNVLYKKVPRINFMNQASENSDYCNYAYRNKNCYLIFGSHYNEDCLYSNYVWKNINCLDCLEVIQSELVYEGIYSDSCYKCSFIEYCFNSSNCHFCYDLIGCKNCLFSSNLRNKEYYIFNKPYSKEEYEKMFLKLDEGTSSTIKDLYSQYKNIRGKAIKRDMFQKNCENCFGTDIQNSKNIYMGFNAKYIEDCRYVDTQATHVADSMDLTCIGYDPSELLYECVGNSGNTRALFCNSCWHDNDVYYCEQCFDSKDLFGCIGLKHKQYCILNKQYSKEEYEEMLPKIIESMKKNKEWGEFFPHTLSQFCYNETIAQIYFPMTEKEALEKGYAWKKKEPKEYKKQKYVVPDKLNDIQESILNEILACEECGRNYKVMPTELTFYKKMNVAIPRKCPDCRHKERVSLKTPRRLWERKCGKCGMTIQTTYAPERPETVYCEKCYLESIN